MIKCRNNQFQSENNLKKWLHKSNVPANMFGSVMRLVLLRLILILYSVHLNSSLSLVFSLDLSTVTSICLHISNVFNCMLSCFLDVANMFKCELNGFRCHKDFFVIYFDWRRFLSHDYTEGTVWTIVLVFIFEWSISVTLRNNLFTPTTRL